MKYSLIYADPAWLYDNKASNGASWVDKGATISVKGDATSAMNYFAIRYNK